MLKKEKVLGFANPVIAAGVGVVGGAIMGVVGGAIMGVVGGAIMGVVGVVGGAVRAIFIATTEQYNPDTEYKKKQFAKAVGILSCVSGVGVGLIGVTAGKMFYDSEQKGLAETASRVQEATSRLEQSSQMPPVHCDSPEDTARLIIAFETAQERKEAISADLARKCKVTFTPKAP